MSNFYSFSKDRLKRDTDQDSLCDFFVNQVIDSLKIQYYTYVVQREDQMRPDLISKKLFGSPDYVEELMVMNNIYNPFSIKEGDSILYCDSADFPYLYVDPTTNNASVVQTLVDPSKSTRKDPARGGTGMTPQIKPDGLQQVTVDYESKKITVPRTFR